MSKESILARFKIHPDITLSDRKNYKNSSVYPMSLQRSEQDTLCKSDSRLYTCLLGIWMGEPSGNASACVREPPFRNSLAVLTNLMFFVVFLSPSRQILDSISNLKSTIVRDIMPCSPLKANLRFGGTYRLHLHGLLPRSRWYFGRLILRPWRWRWYVPPKRRLTFNGLHSVVSQKTVLFIITAVRTSNPAYLKFGHDHFIPRPS
jgi:hypothetical protein